MRSSLVLAYRHDATLSEISSGSADDDDDDDDDEDDYDHENSDNDGNDADNDNDDNDNDDNDDIGGNDDDMIVMIMMKKKKRSWRRCGDDHNNDDDDGDDDDHEQEDDDDDDYGGGGGDDDADDPDDHESEDDDAEGDDNDEDDEDCDGYDDDDEHDDDDDDDDGDDDDDDDDDCDFGSLPRWLWSHERAEFGVTSKTSPVRMRDILSEIMPTEFQRGDVEQECSIQALWKNTSRTRARRVAEVSRFKDCDAIGRCFGISMDTNSWRVDGHHHFGTSTDTLLACWRGQTCLACRREQPFWHVDGRFGMLTRRMSYPAFFRVGLVRMFASGLWWVCLYSPKHWDGPCDICGKKLPSTQQCKDLCKPSLWEGCAQNLQ